MEKQNGEATRQKKTISLKIFNYIQKKKKLSKKKTISQKDNKERKNKEKKSKGLLQNQKNRRKILQYIKLE